MAKDKAGKKKPSKGDKKIAVEKVGEGMTKAGLAGQLYKAADLIDLPDEELLEAVQRQTFRFFWEGAEPASGMARDRSTRTVDTPNDLVAIGGTGFGIMAMIVAMERGWITHAEGLERLTRIIDVIEPTTCFHGAYSHFMHGETGKVWPFSRKDDGGDLIETAFLFQGLLCAREYFDADSLAETKLRKRITGLWGEIEWNWYTQGRHALYWHWSPNNGFVLDHDIHGWNECLIAYVMAVSAPRYPIDPAAYHRGFAASKDFGAPRSYYDIELPLGPDRGGPLFWAHYSFLGLDPRGLKDRYADYWQQNVAHTMINHRHCVLNPHGHKGYGPDCWGLTASDDPDGYAAHQPSEDNGVISPTAALSSFPYAPKEAMAALRHFLTKHGDKLWGRFGFVDAFSEEQDWFAETFLSIDQGPIIVMIENYRTGLIWNLFMRIPEIQAGLRKLGFESPHLTAEAAA
ncbi:glucoamylase family protein [Labrys neptuniae]